MISPRIAEWHGVYSPRGTLEAVDESEYIAHAIAEHLSCDAQGRPQSHLRREVRPVYIVEDLSSFVRFVLEQAKARVSGWPRARKS